MWTRIALKISKQITYRKKYPYLLIPKIEILIWIYNVISPIKIIIERMPKTMANPMQNIG